MWKLIFLAGVGYVIYKLFTNDMRRKAQFAENERRREQERMATAGVMVKDPVCGTYVPADADIRVRDGGSVWCFCSYECRDEYLKRLGSETAHSGDPNRA
jgi:YHS domain-containing protein